MDWNVVLKVASVAIGRDVVRAAVDELVAAGANAATSQREILPEAEFVITPRDLFGRAPVGLPAPQVNVQLAGKGRLQG